MPMTPAQRKANYKYDRQHNTTISVKVTREHAAQFRAACQAAGTTQNKVLHDCMLSFIRQHATPGAPDPDDTE